MAANNGFPTGTTTAGGLFKGASSYGLVQGSVEGDPNIIYDITRGIVSQNETIPMYPGIAVTASVPPISASGPRAALGKVLSRATGLSSITGFTVLNQGSNLFTTPQSNVPNAGSGQSINFVPLGSRARIAVACDPSMISYRGGAVNAQVSWDYVNNMLIPYSGGYTQTAISNAVWSSTNGGQIAFTVGADLTSAINAGDDIEVAGVVNTSGATTSAFNGQWTVVSITSSTITVVALASASIGTYASGGNVLAGGGALPVTIESIHPDGCKVAVYNATTGTINYNNSGAAALIRLTGGTTA